MKGIVQIIKAQFSLYTSFHYFSICSTGSSNSLSSQISPDQTLLLHKRNWASAVCICLKTLFAWHDPCVNL